MQDNFYKELINNLGDGVYFVDRNRRITFWNKGAERITGYSPREVIGKSCSDNILRHIDDNGVDLCLNVCPLAVTIGDGKFREADVYLHHKDGHRVPIRVRISPIYDDLGEVSGAVEVFSDNSRRIDILQEMEKLKKEVFIDELTQVGNRKYAKFNLEMKFQKWKHFQVTFGLLFIDVDHFKMFNDSYGHGLGDRMLKTVANSIGNGLRIMDILCRWGGEEFIVIVPNVKDDKLCEIAERIRMLVEKSFIAMDDKTLKVSISVGGALIREGESLESLVQRADEKMYQSKEQGRNRVNC